MGPPNGYRSDYLWDVQYQLADGADARRGLVGKFGKRELSLGWWNLEVSSFDSFLEFLRHSGLATGSWLDWQRLDMGNFQMMLLKRQGRCYLKKILVSTHPHN